MNLLKKLMNLLKVFISRGMGLQVLSGARAPYCYEGLYFTLVVILKINFLHNINTFSHLNNFPF